MISKLSLAIEKPENECVDCECHTLNSLFKVFKAYAENKVAWSSILNAFRKGALLLLLLLLLFHFHFLVTGTSPKVVLQR
jgi:hypothetical protein